MFNGAVNVKDNIEDPHKIPFYLQETKKRYTTHRFLFSHDKTNHCKKEKKKKVCNINKFLFFSRFPQSEYRLINISIIVLSYFIHSIIKSLHLALNCLRVKKWISLIDISCRLEIFVY